MTRHIELKPRRCRWLGVWNSDVGPYVGGDMGPKVHVGRCGNNSGNPTSGIPVLWIMGHILDQAYKW